MKKKDLENISIVLNKMASRKFGDAPEFVLWLACNLTLIEKNIRPIVADPAKIPNADLYMKEKQEIVFRYCDVGEDGKPILDNGGNCVIKKAKMPYVARDMEELKKRYPGIEEAYVELQLKEKEGLDKTVDPPLLKIDMNKIPTARITPAELAVLLPLINYTTKEVYYGQ